MPSSWIKRTFTDGTGSEGEVSVKMPGREFAREISQRSIQVRASIEELSNAEKETATKDRWLWIIENCKVTLNGDWEGIDFEPGKPLTATEKEKWIDEYFLYAETMGSFIEHYSLNGMPSIDSHKILTTDDLQAGFTKALMSCNNAQEFQERLETMRKEFIAVLERSREITKQIRAEADTNRDPTQTRT